MKRICFVINDLRCGGAERVITFLANMLCKEYDVSLVTVTGYSRNFYKCDDKVQYYAIEKLFGCIDERHSIRIKRLHNIFCKIKPDIIISFLDLAVAYSFLAKPPYSKFIVSERNFPGLRNDDPFIEANKRRAYQSADAFVLQSRWAASYYYEINPRVIVIRNPIWLSQSPLPYQDRKNKIVAIGRLASQKNYPMMLKAFKLFVQRYPNYSLHIFGMEYLEKDKLKKLSYDLGIEGQVFFEGVNEDICASIADAKLYLLSSNWEGMPNGMLEAMAMGLVCVVTNCSYGISEILTNEENGLIVDINDYKSMAFVMEKCVKDDCYSEKISNNAKKIRETLSPQKIIGQWRALIESIGGV